MDPTDDQGPRIIASVSVLAALSTVFLALRVHCKLLRHQQLWWDDHILIISWLSLLVSIALSIVNAQRGFGKHIHAVQPERLPGMGLTSTITGTFSILAAALSKTSFAVTLLRILNGRIKIVVWFIIASINISMGLSALFGWVQCSPVAKVWQVTLPGTCWPPTVYATYGMAAAAYSGVMDFALALLPWKTIWVLQMKKREKLGVALAMSMGVFAGVTALVKTAKIPLLYTTKDFTYHGSELVIWGTAESAVTIIAASLPVLRTLVQQARSKTSYGPNDTTSKRSKIGRTHRAPGEDGDSAFVSKTKQDDQSDRSIFNSMASGITQTREVRIESHGRSDSDTECVHEMHAL